MSGCCFAVSLIATTFGLTCAVVFIARLIHPMLAAIAQTVLIFYRFSNKSIYKAAMDVFEPLSRRDLAQARIRVGYIVGRQTKNLDEAGISRAACETVAENFVDGFYPPCFLPLFSGPPVP